jgi:hypothetical protein
MINSTINTLNSINDITHYIMTTGDNETKYCLISSLNQFNQKIENIYFNMLSKKLRKSTYNHIFNYVIYITIINKIIAS